jgi:phenylalanyl-tRNA synthetase beta subunit
VFGSNREMLHNIFQPLVTDIQKLVGEQVQKVQIKRLKERHPKTAIIKVRKEKISSIF